RLARDAEPGPAARGANPIRAERQIRATIEALPPGRVKEASQTASAGSRQSVRPQPAPAPDAQYIPPPRQPQKPSRPAPGIQTTGSAAAAVATPPYSA